MSDYRNETKYDRLDSCNKCGGLNNECESNPFFSDHCGGTKTICIGGTKTICIDCGFEDYWAYGYYESGQDMVGMSKKYVNRKGKLVDVGIGE